MMNREEALRKAVEIAPADAEVGRVLVYAEWLLEGEVSSSGQGWVSILPLAEGWDDPVEIPVEAMYSVGDIGISRHGSVWVVIGYGVWEIYGPRDGRKSQYTFDTTSAHEHDVVVVGRIRPTSYATEIADLVGDSVFERHSHLYPVGLIALDRAQDVWVYLGDGKWDCYYWNGNGKCDDYSPYSTKVVDRWSAVIVGGIRGQA